MTVGTTISELSDDILSVVLSYLTVRDGTRSRVLSRRWRYLSALTSDLEFDQLTVLGIKDRPEGLVHSHKEQSLRFVSAVDYILQHDINIRRAAGRLHSLKLSYFLRNEFGCYLDKWISFAVGLKIEKLGVDLTAPSLTYRQQLTWYSFSCHLLSEASDLKHLSLKSCILASSVSAACLEVNNNYNLNSLKIINLEKVIVSAQTAFDAILHGCKNLENLTLTKCDLPDSFSIRGPPEPEHIISLKLLGIENCKGASKIEIAYIHLGCLKLASLTGLNLRFVGVSNLMERMDYAVPDIVPQGPPDHLPHLQYLSFYLRCDEIPKMPKNLSKLGSLRELKITLYMYINADILALAGILNACPYLRKFHLEIHCRHRYYDKLKMDGEVEL